LEKLFCKQHTVWIIILGKVLFGSSTCHRVCFWTLKENVYAYGPTSSWTRHIWSEQNGFLADVVWFFYPSCYVAVQVGIHLLLLSLSLVGISPSSWYQLTHCFNTVVEIRLAPEQCLPLQTDTGVDMLCRPRSIIPGLSTTRWPSWVQEWIAGLRKRGAKYICIFFKGRKINSATRWGAKNTFLI
jgi:hypothetical protein